jgi:CRP/FNR family transcriptional regulator, cyclic AMP receptor protein
MRTILLIEDNQDIRENMAEILEMSNYKVLTAPDGKEGVALAIEHKPDLVVCDIMMPVLDGYGVIHMLQKNDDTSNIPFIFLTAKAWNWVPTTISQSRSMVPNCSAPLRPA